MTQFLKIGLVHLSVKYKEPVENRADLVELNRQAASCGAKIIVNTEMAVSGYSFISRQDVAPYAESFSGPTVTALSSVAREHGAYIIVGLPEKDELTGIIYNTAFAIGPEGDVVCRYRKINGEARWACPGSERQQAVFETPWGRIGVLVCSDSYYGLIPRTLALQGADLIVIPANWPPSGMNPVDLWKMRALENGFAVAACNRTGQDRLMDCSQAQSCVISQEGEVIFAKSSPDSNLFLAELPLDGSKRLCSRRRQEIMALRKPGYYGDIYPDLRMIPDMTSWHELPQPGKMRLSVFPGKYSPDSVHAWLQNAGQEKQGDIPHLVLLSRQYAQTDSVRIMENLAADHNAAVAAVLKDSDAPAMAVLAEPGKISRIAPFSSKAQNLNEGLQSAVFGSVKTAFLEKDTLIHPEVSVALAKQGCDLVLVSEETLDQTDCLLMGSRSFERLVVGYGSHGKTGIVSPPEGHGPCTLGPRDENGVSSMIFDSAALRFKRFQERINYSILLRKNLCQEGD